MEKEENKKEDEQEVSELEGELTEEVDEEDQEETLPKENLEVEEIKSDPLKIPKIETPGKFELGPKNQIPFIRREDLEDDLQATTSFQDKNKDQEGEIKYIESAERQQQGNYQTIPDSENQPPSYTSLENASQRISRVDINKVGRDFSPHLQNMGLRHSENIPQEPSSFETKMEVQRIDVQQAGRQNPFETQLRDTEKPKYDLK